MRYRHLLKYSNSQEMIWSSNCYCLVCYKCLLFCTHFVRSVCILLVLWVLGHVCKSTWFTNPTGRVSTNFDIRLPKLQVTGRIFDLRWPFYQKRFLLHSVEQKSIGLKFSKSRTGSDVRYSSHHISSRVIPHICAFVAFFCLPFITINHTAHILTEDNNTFA